jgi:hypothetical protein
MLSCYAMQAPRGRGIQLLFILDRGTRWGSVVSVTTRLLFTLRERTLGAHWIGDWVGPRAGLNTELEEKPFASVGNQTPVAQSSRL